MQQAPIEPSAEARMLAAETQDQFQAFLQSGFTRAEALHLVAVSMSAGYFADWIDE